jgi:PKD repeat protein
MKKLLFISTLVLLTFTTKLSAQFVNIPDLNFKSFLLSNSSINTTFDAEITYVEASAYNGSIFAGTQGISDLTGIEAFTNLTVLDVSQNALSTIDLSQNIALTSFNCSFNSLTCLDLSNNPNLTSVDCSMNNLTKLNLKSGNNIALTSMTCTGNAIGLTCIQVDNAAAAMSAPGWNEDTWSVYNALCTQPVAGFTTNAPVCYNSSVVFTNTSLNSTQWFWDFGDTGISTNQNPGYIYGSIGDYAVTLVAQNCYGKDTIVDTVVQGTAIYGTASYTLGPITGGTAVLMPYQSYYVAFDTCQTATVDAAGNYFFNNALDGDYVIKIFPDTLLNPTLISTYYLDAWAWDSATVLTHGCVADDVANITMVEMIGVGGGIGLAQGIVQQGIGFGRANGDPVHGVDVKLGITGTDQIVDQTTTDVLGQYTFSNLIFGNYSIYVDIPGLERDSVYDIVIDAVNNQFPNLNYLVDSVAIFVLPNIGIEEIDATDPSFKIYPNPVKENATINYSIHSNADVKLDIYNISGTKVMSVVNMNQSPGDYTINFNPTTNKLKSGIYFMALSGDGKTKVKRIVITE